MLAHLLIQSCTLSQSLLDGFSPLVLAKRRIPNHRLGREVELLETEMEVRDDQKRRAESSKNVPKDEQLGAISVGEPRREICSLWQRVVDVERRRPDSVNSNSICLLRLGQLWHSLDVLLQRELVFSAAETVYHPLRALVCGL